MKIRGIRIRPFLLVPAIAAGILWACGADEARAPNASLDADYEDIDSGEYLCDESDPACCGGQVCEAPDVCVEGACQPQECIANSQCPTGFVCSPKSHLCIPALDGGPVKQDAGPRDAGPKDAGPRDAGPRDAGPRDAGPRDAGPIDGGPRDAGPRDAGPIDAGPRDGGPVDAGPRDGRPIDAGPRDGGAPDAGTRDGGVVTRDAGPADAGSCHGTCPQTCGNGTTCNTATCQCVNPNSTCASSSDCLSGFVCVPVQQLGMNYCIQLCGGSSGTTCPSGQPCCPASTFNVSYCSPVGQCF